MRGFVVVLLPNSATLFSFPDAPHASWLLRAGERKNGRLWFEKCTILMQPSCLQIKAGFSYHEFNF
jgi:hypothetical protein